MKNLINLNFKTYAQIELKLIILKRFTKILKSWKQNIFKTIINYNKQKKLFLRKNSIN